MLRLQYLRCCCRLCSWGCQGLGSIDGSYYFFSCLSPSAWIIAVLFQDQLNLLNYISQDLTSFFCDVNILTLAFACGPKRCLLVVLILVISTSRVLDHCSTLVIWDLLLVRYGGCSPETFIKLMNAEAFETCSD